MKKNFEKDPDPELTKISLHPFYIITYNIGWDKVSWTYSSTRILFGSSFSKDISKVFFYQSLTTNEQNIDFTTAKHEWTPCESRQE